MNQAQTLSIEIDIPALIPSWQRSLKAARRSPRTVKSYTEAAEQLAEYLLRKGMPTAVASIRREHLESFMVDLDARFKPATVGVSFRSLRQLFKWLLEEGEITSDPMERMRPPRVAEDPPAVLTDAELMELVKACEGAGLAERRDLAIIRVFVDTGARLSEVVRLAHVHCNSRDRGLRNQIRAMLEKDPSLPFKEIAARLTKKPSVEVPPPYESWTAGLVRTVCVS